MDAHLFAKYLLEKGISEMNGMDFMKALQTFHEVSRTYPNSPYGSFANAVINYEQAPLKSEHTNPIYYLQSLKEFLSAYFNDVGYPIGNYYIGDIFAKLGTAVRPKIICNDHKFIYRIIGIQTLLRTASPSFVDSDRADYQIRVAYQLHNYRTEENTFQLLNAIKNYLHPVQISLNWLCLEGDPTDQVVLNTDTLILPNKIRMPESVFNAFLSLAYNAVKLDLDFIMGVNTEQPASIFNHIDKIPGTISYIDNPPTLNR